MITEDEFKEKLKKLCLDYDLENGEYPESEYQGNAIFYYYLISTFPEVSSIEDDEYLQELENKQKKKDKGNNR